MRLFGALALVLVAFAGNSVLNRLALVSDGAIGALEFAMIRVLAGAVTLVVLVRLRDRGRERQRHAPTSRELAAAGALALYLLGFSLAYLSLPAGPGWGGCAPGALAGCGWGVRRARLSALAGWGRGP